MLGSQRFQLGEPVPNTPHSVVSNIPTLADVCAYEEKDPRVQRAMKQGYPRFVRHHWVQALTRAVMESSGLDADAFFAVLVYHSETLLATVQSLDPNVQCRAIASDVFGTESYLLYVNVYRFDSVKQLRAFVQHTGIEISSRNAEVGLKSMGELPLSDSEVQDDSEIEVAKQRLLSAIRREVGTQSEAAVRLTASGMNAFYAAFKAIQGVQQSQGRNHWIQVGWLYVDSGSILDRYLTEDELLEVVFDPIDTDAIIEKIKSAGEALSGLVVECPTNPFCQIADLKRIAEAVWEVGALMLVDPSVASFYNIHCLPYSDIVVSSLTKYLGFSADVMAGAIALNERGRAFKCLLESVEQTRVPLYDLDALRLNEMLNQVPDRIAQMNRNCKALAEYLKGHPKVKKLFSVSENKEDSSYLKGASAYGSILSIELEGSLERFYDALDLVKGPSFGAEFTIVCPYFYLAHYDLVLDESSEGVFNRLGIDRNLIRISVGCESIESLIQSFSAALDQA